MVFFCGDRSHYGVAHLAPLFEHFDVAAVVVADDARWRTFRASLRGQPLPPVGLLRQWRRRVRAVMPEPVATVLRRAAGRAPDIATRARAHGVVTWTVHDVNDDAFLDRLRTIEHDLILSAAYPQIFGAALLAVPPRGSVNFHPSALPAFRGAHPHFWAIATGARESGVTAHFMTERLDDGDVIDQTRFPIGHLTYGTLYDRIVAETPDLVARTRVFFDDSESRPMPQDAAAVSFFRNDRELHRRIFWERHDTVAIHNLCRTERAFCFFRGRETICLGGRRVSPPLHLNNDPVVPPGIVLRASADAVVVGTVDGAVALTGLRERGRVLSAAHWIRRRRPRIGERFD